MTVKTQKTVKNLGGLAPLAPDKRRLWLQWYTMVIFSMGVRGIARLWALGRGPKHPKTLLKAPNETKSTY